MRSTGKMLVFIKDTLKKLNLSSLNINLTVPYSVLDKPFAVVSELGNYLTPHLWRFSLLTFVFVNIYAYNNQSLLFIIITQVINILNRTK